MKEKGEERNPKIKFEFRKQDRKLKIRLNTINTKSVFFKNPGKNYFDVHIFSGNTLEVFVCFVGVKELNVLNT